MKIQAGYEISYDCAQPTPMLLMLRVHPSRQADLESPERIAFDPPVRATEYRDGFGNLCTRVTAPPGRITISNAFVARDSGEPDLVVPTAEQHPLDDLPDHVLAFLLGSRYCDTDRLSDEAWALFGKTPPGWARVQAICDYVHERLEFGYEHASSSAPPGTGTTRAAASAATSPISRSRSAAASTSRPATARAILVTSACRAIPRRWTSAPGSRSISRRPVVRLRRPAQHPAHRPHPDGARARRHRRRALDELRPLHARGLQGRHRRGDVSVAGGEGAGEGPRPDEDVSAFEHDGPPVVLVNAAGRSPFVLLCEHASRLLPPGYGRLGLARSELDRHIAWDIGAAEVATRLACLLDAPLFLAGYSRLVIDLNRPPGSETSIPEASEATARSPATSGSTRPSGGAGASAGSTPSTRR